MFFIINMKRSKKTQSNVPNTMQSGTANDNNNIFFAIRGWLLEKLYYSGAIYLKNYEKGSVLKKLPDTTQLLLEKNIVLIL